jgi:hypothetical protein
MAVKMAAKPVNVTAAVRGFMYLFERLTRLVPSSCGTTTFFMFSPPFSTED